MIQRLIDADAFKKSVLTDFWEHYTQCHDTDQTSLMDMVMDNLDEQPTIDAIPVVRCRECKEGEIDDPDFPYQYYCHAGFGWNKGNFYCYYGERKGGDGNG